MQAGILFRSLTWGFHVRRSSIHTAHAIIHLIIIVLGCANHMSGCTNSSRVMRLFGACVVHNDAAMAHH